MAGLTAARSLVPLRHRGFRLLVAGQFTSNVGDAFYAVALPWYVLASHGGALLLGTVLAAYGIPRTALLILGGQASDRWRPWTVMMATDILRAVALAAFAVAASLGPARAVILVPIAVALGAGEGLFLPGSFAIVPALLPGEDLQAGNALASGGTELAMLVGPAIGGALVALLGSPPAFALDAATFAVSALTLAGVRATRRPPPASVAPPEVSASAAAAGEQDPPASAAGRADSPQVDTPTLRTMLRSERVLQISLLVSVAANLGLGGMSEVALPSLVRGPLHGGAGGYGALLAAFGVGALVGTLAAGQVRRARRPFVVGAVAFLAEAVFIAAVPYTGSTVAAAATLIALGAMNGFGNVVMITAFQRWAPPQALGRLMGLLMLASFGTFPISVALAAVVVHNLGPALFFPLAAALLVAALLAGLSQRSWRDFGAPTPVTARQPGNSRPGTAPAGADSKGISSTVGCR